MDAPWNVDDRRLRQFAVFWILFSFGFAIRFCWPTRANEYAALAAGLAVLLGVVGWRRPYIIRPIYVAWMVAVTPVSWIVSKTVLAVIFFGLFTPVSLFFRILGRDALNLKPQSGAKSLWIPKRLSNNPRQYLRQY